MVTMRFVFALLFAAPLFGQSCTYVATPADLSIGAGTTPGSFTVNQAPGGACSNYTVSVDVTLYPWLHITSNVSGTLGGAVTFIADANQSASPRAGA